MNEPDPKDVLEAGAKALFGPVHELFMKLTGPAAEEYGLMWKDSVKLRRTKRLVKGLCETKRILEEASLQATAVPDKLLLPIFDGMSLEDDNTLQAMWSGLLASASSGQRPIHAGFVSALRQLSPDEAVLLNWIFDQVAGDSDFTKETSISNLHMAYAELGFGSVYGDDSLLRGDVNEGEFISCLLGLEALKLIQLSPDGGNYFLTHRGYQFVSACRLMKSPSNTIQAIRC